MGGRLVCWELQLASSSDWSRGFKVRWRRPEVGEVRLGGDCLPHFDLECHSVDCREPVKVFNERDSVIRIVS